MAGFPDMGEKGKHTLGDLTQAFVQHLMNAKGEEVDLGLAGDALGASKRRLYDVTNVLAGIGVIERCGKSKVRWIDAAAPVDEGKQLKDLLAQEAEVDRMTAVIDDSLMALSQSTDFQNHAWVSEDDVMHLADDGVTLFALRGPPDLTIEVPDEDEGERHRIVCTSQTGGVDLIPITHSLRR
jgi:transcription factor E2F3